MSDAPGVELIDDAGDYPTAVSDASGNDTVLLNVLELNTLMTLKPLMWGLLLLQ